MLKDFTSENLLRQFFAPKFNAINFLNCWHYMEQYVDVERSSALGQFYMKSMSLFPAMKFVDLFVVLT